MGSFLLSAMERTVHAYVGPQGIKDMASKSMVMGQLSLHTGEI